MFSVAFMMLADAENAEAQLLDKREQRVTRRKLRDTCNPFELPQTLFEKYYRVNKPAFKYLLDVLMSHIQPKRKSFAISPVVKLSATLRFFAEGGYQTGIGKDCDVSVAQCSLSKTLKEVIASTRMSNCFLFVVFDLNESKC